MLTDADELEEQPYVTTAESLSMAFLVLLESLSPVERAVFLLREVFDYRWRQPGIRLASGWASTLGPDVRLGAGTGRRAQPPSRP